MNKMIDHSKPITTACFSVVKMKRFRIYEYIRFLASLSLFIFLASQLAHAQYTEGGLTSDEAIVLNQKISEMQKEGTVPATPADSNFTFVIVHGAWGGGWAFKEVDQMLAADGHTVYRPTLTGQGERVHLADSSRLGADIDLSLHIQDVVNVILWEDLQDLVLVGHSYGGMVITGVADKVPDRIRHVIYLDAFLPENGESLYTAGRDDRGPPQDSTGFVVPGWLSGDEPLPHDVPHPAQTLSEPISLTNQKAAGKLPTTYILTAENPEEPEKDSFYRFYERARDRNWEVQIMEGGHNVQWSHPNELVDLIEQMLVSATKD